ALAGTRLLSTGCAEATRAARGGQTGRLAIFPGFPMSYKAAAKRKGPHVEHRGRRRSGRARPQLVAAPAARGRAARDRGDQGRRLRPRRRASGALPDSHGMRPVRSGLARRGRRAAPRRHRGARPAARRGPRTCGGACRPLARGDRGAARRARGGLARRGGARARRGGGPGRRGGDRAGAARRGGVSPDEARALLEKLAASPELDLEGVSTHFARADEADPAPTRAQLESFRRVVDAARARGVRPRSIHAANSAALLAAREWGESVLAGDAVRPGLALSGVAPAAHLPDPERRA